jgi:hypothetical protein
MTPSPAAVLPLMTTADARRLFEDLRDLVLGRVGIATINPAEHPEHEHVLALARVGYDFEALFLDRQFMHDQSLRFEIGESLLILIANSLLGVFGPHALQQNDRAFLVGAVIDTGIEHLFVECDDHIGLIAHVGHVFRSHSNAYAAGALAFARGRLNFGRYDLYRPDTVAHLAAHQSQDLTAFLRAFAGIADDFDDMLVYLA